MRKLISRHVELTLAGREITWVHAVGLDSVELVLAVEQEFSIEIPDAIAEKLYTVGELHSFVVSELRRNGGKANTDDIFNRLRELICEQLAIKPERVIPDARFVQDLGLN